MILPTRLRRSPEIRSLIKETRLDPKAFIYPVFVHEESEDEEIESMPGQKRVAIKNLKNIVKNLRENDIHAVLLFGIPKQKDAIAEAAYIDDGIVQQAIRELKKLDPNLYVITDVCLCEYKSDGHCCFFNKDGSINRAKTLEALSKTALSHAKAGADMVAPSDMMDGHIQAIRETLDKNSYENTAIMGYSSKFASGFYGPFRDAADSAPEYGDRKSYQMDPANSKEAIKELELDLIEGADVVMVKPAMPYLDIIEKGSRLTNLPMAAYQVSGEYSMLKSAVENNILDESVLYESLLAIKRAGADIIISYFAPEVKELIKKYQS